MAVWILDSGFWILDSGFWILDSGFSNVESPYQPRSMPPYPGVILKLSFIGCCTIYANADTASSWTIVTSSSH